MRARRFVEAVGIEVVAEALRRRTGSIVWFVTTTIVLAEDSFIVRVGIRMLLEGAGYEILAIAETYDELTAESAPGHGTTVRGELRLRAATGDVPGRHVGPQRRSMERLRAVDSRRTVAAEPRSSRDRPPARRRIMHSPRCGSQSRGAGSAVSYDRECGTMPAADRLRKESRRSSLHLRYLVRQSLVLATRPETQVTPRHLPVFQKSAPWLLVIVGVGLFLRTWQLMALGLNSDEAVYAGQAASIAGDTSLLPYFPIFRAHPLLFQTFLSIPYQMGTSPLVGRLASVAIGIATILVVYATGRLLYDRRVGLLAAAFIAVMPYHVVVTRQVLLDGTLTLFATVSLFFMARFGQTRQVLWLYASFGAMGLTVLSKESGILFFGAIYVFVALFGHVKIRQLVVAMVVFVAVVLPFPLSVAFSGRSSTGEQYLSWQLFRRANHTWSFYLTEVPPAIGLLVVGLAIYTLIVLRRSSTWRETLLVPWILVPLMFYELWPTKGFQYLLPIAVPLAILASRGLIALADGRLPLPHRMRGVRRRRWFAPVAIGVVVVSLLLPSWSQIQPTRADGQFLAGTGGVPGGREAGEWVAANVPVGAQLLAVGPSMANIIQFYGKRKTYGLSVSPNPLHRNPVYEPVNNPDLGIRSNDFQYLVWDSYSAGRTEFFSARLLRYVERYNGRVIHTESIPVDAGDGSMVNMPVIVIYEVRP